MGTETIDLRPPLHYTCTTARPVDVCLHAGGDPESSALRQLRRTMTEHALMELAEKRGRGPANPAHADLKLMSPSPALAARSIQSPTSSPFSFSPRDDASGPRAGSRLQQFEQVACIRHDPGLLRRQEQGGPVAPYAACGKPGYVQAGAHA